MKSKTVEGIKLDLIALVNLPLLQRLLHKKSRKTLIACTIGMIIMLCGSLIAQSGHAIGHYLGISYIFVDCGGYFVHGAGALPIFRHIEMLWAIVLGVSKAEIV